MTPGFGALCDDRVDGVPILERSDRVPYVRLPYGGPRVRIRLPPAVSQVRTCLSREFAFLGREATVFRGVEAGTSGAVGRDTQGAATSG